VEKITPEKALEYKQVSALVCLDLDILYDISQDPNETLEGLREQIKYVYDMKELAIKDAKGRKERYDASSMLFSLAANGQVKCTELPL
jgi:hypothetical protein